MSADGTTTAKARRPRLRHVSRLSCGTLADVFLCEREGRHVVLKVVDKSRLATQDQRTQAQDEITALRTASRYRFVVRLNWARESPSHISMCMEFCDGGDLFTLMHTVDLPGETSALILAQLALALDYLGRHNIVYRDLKPENVGLARTGHVRLLDFGLAKVLGEEHRNAVSGRLEIASTSGTLAYTAPEVLRRVPHSFEVDWWGLGILAHELLAGWLPFEDPCPEVHCSNICKQPLDLSQSFTSDDEGLAARAFVSNLLQRDGRHRLGFHADCFEFDILEHDFFAGVDWIALEDQSQSLPYGPHCHAATGSL